MSEKRVTWRVEFQNPHSPSETLRAVLTKPGAWTVVRCSPGARPDAEMARRIVEAQERADEWARTFKPEGGCCGC